MSEHHDLRAKLERWAADDSDPERQEFALGVLVAEKTASERFNDRLRADAKRATRPDHREKLFRKVEV
jgi:hypothetical protein